MPCCPNLGAFAASDLEPELVRRVYPMFVVDKQGRCGIEAPWAAGRVAKRSRGLYPDRPIGLIRSVGPEQGFVCVSRGGIADDAALLDALREGEIAGAGLDAHGVEPLPADSPFWTLPNVIVTPHNGATTRETARRGLDILLDNLGRFTRGEPLRNVVDKAAGY